MSLFYLNLQQLSIYLRIKWKLHTMTFNILHHLAPAYLSELTPAT